ncbi:hypothetical protein LCGC14_2196140 [marine sediment metagenome]|uniref:Uncharacterized protein n=1 Tax=marine sediment metagenome TaxID=412755 RepID=A0A0F9E589_9ZZZZ
MKYKIDLSTKEGLQAVMARAEDTLLMATHNYEMAIEEEKIARMIYIDGYSTVFLSVLSGDQKIGEKKVPPSVVDKATKALCKDSYHSYENSLRESKKREEVMNSIKKLLDQRTRLGG